MGNNMLNFIFVDGAAPISDGLERFLLRTRAEIIDIRQRKILIYIQQYKKNQTCNKLIIVKHNLNCCLTKVTRITEKYYHIRRILAQSINIHIR
jgi:hypothetical protein